MIRITRMGSFRRMRRLVRSAIRSGAVAEVKSTKIPAHVKAHATGRWARFCTMLLTAPDCLGALWMRGGRDCLSYDDCKTDGDNRELKKSAYQHFNECQPSAPPALAVDYCAQRGSVGDS